MAGKVCRLSNLKNWGFTVWCTAKLAHDFPNVIVYNLPLTRAYWDSFFTDAIKACKDVKRVDYDTETEDEDIGTKKAVW